MTKYSLKPYTHCCCFKRVFGSVETQVHIDDVQIPLITINVLFFTEGNGLFFWQNDLQAQTQAVTG